MALAIRGWNSRLPVIHLSDGRTVRILKVSVGTNHVLSAEPLWKRGVRSVLPQMLEKPLGPAREHRKSSRYDTLVVFMEPLQGEIVHSLGHPSHFSRCDKLRICLVSRASICIHFLEFSPWGTYISAAGQDWNQLRT